jgi:hypothetical protein
MAPVPASDIGEWVEQMAGQALAARTQVIGLIERSSTSSLTAISGSEHLPITLDMQELSGPSTMSSPASSRAPSSFDGALPGVQEASLTNGSAIVIPVQGPRGRHVVAGALGIFVALALAGTILIAGSFSKHPSADANGTTPSAQSAAPTPPPPTTASVATAEFAPSSSPPDSVPAAVPSPPPSARPPTAIPHRPAAPPITTARPAVPNCDPPYTVAADGTRRYKRECAR